MLSTKQTKQSTNSNYQKAECAATEGDHTAGIRTRRLDAWQLNSKQSDSATADIIKARIETRLDKKKLLFSFFQFLLYIHCAQGSFLLVLIIHGGRGVGKGGTKSY